MGEGVEERRLAGVGVADDGDDGELAPLPPAAADLPLAREVGDAPVEVGDAVADAPAVDFQLRLARPASADAARQPRERVVALAEARKEVLELRELDLQLAVGALGALGEDVQNQLSAVEDLEARLLGDVAALRGAQVAVEDDDVRHELHRAQDELLELALAHQVARVRLTAHLEDGVEHLHPGGAREFPQLAQGGLGR